VLFIAGSWTAIRWRDVAWFSEGLVLYAPVVFGVGLFLAWRFGRSRVGAVLVGLVLLSYLPNSDSVGASAGSPWETGGLILLIFIGVLSLLKDRGVFSRLGIVQPLCAAAGVSGGWALMRGGRSEALAWVWHPVLPGGLTPWSGISDVTVFVGIASFALTMRMALRRDHPVEKALLWALICVLVALASGAGSDGANLYLMVAGLILAIAVMEMSYAMAFQDELTGLPARRALWQELDAAGRSYAVGMLDIDHFKDFNDRHGHDVGDQVLRLVAARLGEVTGGGRAFRYGGEEFAVVFPSIGRDDARGHLEALRKTIEEGEFAVRGRGRPWPKASNAKTRRRAGRKAGRKGGLSLTVSIGVAERNDKSPTAEAVVKAADKALYRAKKRGRNRVAR
jgi:diguanylate cyclase (GGDEF)-like protein